LSRHLLGQAPEEPVAGDSFEESFLESFTGHTSGPSPYDSTDKEADYYHQEKRQGDLTRDPVREQEGNRPHQAHERFYSFEEQKQGEINRYDNEQATKHRSSDEDE
jgi:hypothetical protein